MALDQTEPNIQPPVAISMALTAELASQLAERGISLPVFVSPNIASVPKDNNEQVFAEYRRRAMR